VSAGTVEITLRSVAAVWSSEPEGQTTTAGKVWNALLRGGRVAGTDTGAANGTLRR
jgi:hypothetical protein